MSLMHMIQRRLDNWNSNSQAANTREIHHWSRCWDVSLTNSNLNTLKFQRKVYSLLIHYFFFLTFSFSSSWKLNSWQKTAALIVLRRFCRFLPASPLIPWSVRLSYGALKLSENMAFIKAWLSCHRFKHLLCLFAAAESGSLLLSVINSFLITNQPGGQLFIT